MSEIVVREISSAQYSEHLAAVPHPIFHRVAWLDAVASVFSLQIRLLGYFRDESLIAVTPLMVRRMGPLKICGAPLRKCSTPPAVPFCTPSAYQEVLLPNLRNWSISQQIGYLQVSMTGASSQPPIRANRIESLDNLELDLRPPLIEIWRTLSDLPKRCIRKAVRAGVKIHWRYCEDLLACQRSLVEATYGKQGINPNTPENLYALLFHHRNEVTLRVLSATHAGRTIASIWMLRDTEKCYYWDAAALDESRELWANHLMVWCLIRWARRNGLLTLDFVGPSSGGRGGTRSGIGRFKQSMGGREVAYRLVYWYSPFMHIAFVLYRVVQRLRTSLMNLTSFR